MADYHIYLHSDTGGLSEKTVPFDDRQSKQKLGGFTTEKSEEQEIAESSAEGFVGKVAPAVALVVAAAKITDKVLTTGFDHLAEYTGKYEYSMGMNNFNTFISHIVNPVGYFKQVIRRNAQYNKINKQIQQESLLIGDTIFTNRKIGV